jgi:hypothetical protein
MFSLTGEMKREKQSQFVVKEAVQSLITTIAA